MNENQHKPEDDSRIIERATSGEYKYGFTSDIDTDIIPAGLNEDVVRRISEMKTSAWRLSATG